MIALMKYFVDYASALAEALPYITCCCIGGVAAVFTLFSILSERTDKRLTIGYGASAVTCFAGALYGAMTGTYYPLLVGPGLFALAFRAHFGDPGLFSLASHLLTLAYTKIFG